MIELRMLGRLSLTGADGREVRGLLGQPRRLALLAHLAAASPQGSHRRDTLLALFWPALDLYRGALLEGFFISDAPEFERWLETERARLQQAAAGAARALAERYESDNDLTRAVRWTRRSIELAPSDESLARRMI